MMPGEHPLTLRARVARVSATPTGVVERYLRWLSEGKHAGMKYLENHIEIRRDPGLLLKGAQTLIMCAVPYPLSDPTKQTRIASYALGKDYHDVLRKLFCEGICSGGELQRGGWRLCVDSAPVSERHWAFSNGLGVPTLSGMAAVKGLGTACLLFGIYSTLGIEEMGIEPGEMTPDDFKRLTGVDIQHHPDAPEPRCLGAVCGACMAACPAKALKNGEVDARRCLSYLTIEHRGEWTSPEALDAMHTREGRETLFGCDRCVKACPLNRPPYRVQENLGFVPGLLPNPLVEAISPEDITAMDREEFNRLFNGSPVKRAKYSGLLRNALNCAGCATGRK